MIYHQYNRPTDELDRADSRNRPAQVQSADSTKVLMQFKGKKIVFPEMTLGHLDVHLQQNKENPLKPLPHCKKYNTKIHMKLTNFKN